MAEVQEFGKATVGRWSIGACGILGAYKPCITHIILWSTFIQIWHESWAQGRDSQQNPTVGSFKLLRPNGRWVDRFFLVGRNAQPKTPKTYIRKIQTCPRHLMNKWPPPYRHPRALGSNPRCCSKLVPSATDKMASVIGNRHKGW